MLFFPVSLVIYLIEMLISYIVFSYVSCQKQSAPIVLVTGALIFGSGAVVNYIFSNTVWLNFLYTMIMNYAFAVICFHIRYRTAIVYSVLMNVLSVAFEFTTIFLVSLTSHSGLTEYNNDLTVLAVEAAISKTAYFISCILLMRIPKKANTPVDNIPSSFFFTLFVPCLHLFPFGISVPMKHSAKLIKSY